MYGSALCLQIYFEMWHIELLIFSSANVVLFQTLALIQQSEGEGVQISSKSAEEECHTERKKSKKAGLKKDCIHTIYYK